MALYSIGAYVQLCIYREIDKYIYCKISVGGFGFIATGASRRTCFAPRRSVRPPWDAPWTALAPTDIGPDP